MPEFDESLIEKFMNELNIERITAKCLINSGLKTVEECKNFLHPSLDSLTNVNDYPGYLAVKDRVQQAIDNKEKVVIYGDYDCDGVCSTAMLYEFLTSKGVDVDYFIPDRRQDGYGLNIEALEEITEEFNPDLIITVDCGISSVEEVNYIYEALGFDIVVTDHHSIPETLPDCPIFNPHLSKDGQFENLCGAGVVLRLIEGLTSLEESLKYYDIAAIATVADVVPLVGDNRVIVKKGLEYINKRSRKGLDLLIKSFTNEKITSTEIAFKLAPRINAVGRLENTNKLIDLFVDKDDFVLSTLVEEINEINIKRQMMTKKLAEDVKDSLSGYDFDKYPIIVLSGKDWDEGVLGIVAASVVQEYNHPVILFTQNGDKIKGSGRSLPGVNIFECVSQAKDILERFGGHPQACGLTLNKSDLEEFKDIINSYCKKTYPNEVFLKDINEYFDFHEISNLLKVVKELELLQPYGEGNKKPVFGSEIQNLKFTRMKPGSPHIIFKNRTFQMIGFNMADRLPLLNNSLNKLITFNLAYNIYNNMESAQAIIKHVHFIDFVDGYLDNFLSTIKYEDKSIFKPKQIALDEALSLIKDNDYSTAFIAYSNKTIQEFKKKCNKEIIYNAFYMDFAAPNNAVYFNLNEEANLDKYKNLVFLDRPLSLGFIDILKLNKDCNVYYVNSENAYKVLKEYLPDYKTLGQIFMEMGKSMQYGAFADVYSLYVDIEKKLNVNYNYFVVALSIFMDLGIVVYKDNLFKIDKSKKNPIQNSNLYKNIVGA